jgi:hypothetical protein
VLAEKRGEFADRFDAVHSVERAVRVGSVTTIVPSGSLRPFLIDAVEQGMRRMEGEDADGVTNGRAGLAQPTAS